MVRAWRVHGPFDFYVSSARHTCSTPTLGRAHRPSYTSPPALPGPGIVRIMDLLGNETACKWAAPVIGASSHTPRRRAEPVGPARRVPRAPPVASHTPCPSRPTCPARHVSRVPPVASCAPHRRVPRAPPLRPTRPARRIPHALPVASRGSRPSRPARPAIASHAPRRRVPRAPPSRLAHHVPDPQRRASTTPHASGPTQTRVWPHHTSGRPSDVPKSPTHPAWPHARAPTTTDAPRPFSTCRGRAGPPTTRLNDAPRDRPHPDTRPAPSHVWPPFRRAQIPNTSRVAPCTRADHHGRTWPLLDMPRRPSTRSDWDVQKAVWDNLFGPEVFSVRNLHSIQEKYDQPAAAS